MFEWVHFTPFQSVSSYGDNLWTRYRVFTKAEKRVPFIVRQQKAEVVGYLLCLTLGFQKWVAHNWICLTPTCPTHCSPSQPCTFSFSEYLKYFAIYFHMAQVHHSWKYSSGAASVNSCLSSCSWKEAMLFQICQAHYSTLIHFSQKLDCINLTLKELAYFFLCILQEPRSYCSSE